MTGSKLNFLALLLTAQLICGFRTVADSQDKGANAIMFKGLTASRWESKDAAEKVKLISELRTIMFNGSSDSPGYDPKEQARIELLNIGDEVAFSDTIKLYKGRYWERRRMAGIMEQTEQPLLIAILAEDLKSEEPADAQKWEGEFLAGPR